MSTSVYLIFGEEYLASAKAKQTIETLVPPENQALGLEVIDGMADTVTAAIAALDCCIEAIQTVGFLNNQSEGSLGKVVWLRDVSFLIDNVVGQSQAVKSRIDTLVEMIKVGLSPGQILVITAPKVDKRYIFYKACKAAGEVFEFALPDKPYQAKQQAVRQTKAAFKKAGLKVGDEVLEAFLEKVGTDTRQIMNEIEKLAVFKGEVGEIQLSDVEIITCSSREVPAWDLADAFGNRDMIRALGILRQLIFQKANPIGLIISLENRIRDLMIYREALDKGWLKVKSGNTFAWGSVPPEVDVMFSEQYNKDPRSTHPYRVGLLADQARLFSAQELQEYWGAVMAAHEKLVSSIVPKPIILELLLIKMMG